MAHPAPSPVLAASWCQVSRPSITVKKYPRGSTQRRKGLFGFLDTWFYLGYWCGRMSLITQGHGCLEKWIIIYTQIFQNLKKNPPKTNNQENKTTKTKYKTPIPNILGLLCKEYSGCVIFLKSYESSLFSLSPFCMQILLSAFAHKLRKGTSPPRSSMQTAVNHFHFRETVQRGSHFSSQGCLESRAQSPPEPGTKQPGGFQLDLPKFYDSSVWWLQQKGLTKQRMA